MTEMDKFIPTAVIWAVTILSLVYNLILPALKRRKAAGTDGTITRTVMVPSAHLHFVVIYNISPKSKEISFQTIQQLNGKQFEFEDYEGG